MLSVPASAERIAAAVVVIAVLIQAAMEDVAGRGVPEWLSLDRDNFIGQVLELPTREAIKIPIEESLIVELYSK